jgi:iron complex outermembrane receptor protein
MLIKKNVLKLTLNVRTAIPIALTPALIASSVMVHAQEQRQGVLEQIVVTAQKREQQASDVGIAINAFSGDQIRNLGIQDSIDIISFSPGVYLSTDTGGQNKKFTIRGVTQNDFLDALEAPVAVYVDEGYVAPQQGQVFGAFDLERIEVLKGPQGTLFGRNATGGLVHYVTEKPNLDNVEGFMEIGYGSHNEVRLEGAVNLPLTDKIAARISGLYNSHDPMLKNLYPAGAVTLNPDPQPGPDLRSQEMHGVRLHLLMEPTERLRVLLSAADFQLKQDTGGYEMGSIVPVFDDQGRWINSVLASPDETRPGIGPGGTSVPVFGVSERPLPGGNLFGYRDEVGDFSGSFDFAERNGNEYENSSLSLKFEWDVFEDIQMVALSDYRTYSKIAGLDVDAGPVDQFQYMADAETDTFTQEIRFSGGTDSTNWVFGAFFLDISNDTLQGLPFSGTSILNTGGGPFGLDFATEVTLDTSSYSVFGQFDYALSDYWTVVVGARVIYEDKDFTFAQNAYVNLNESRIEDDVLAFPIPQPPGANPFAEKFDDTLFAGKVQLEYRPTDDWLLYGGVNRGVKAGSVNGPLADGGQVTAEQLIYDPEELLSYEIGFKGTALNDLLTVNGSAYYYDYTDYQAFTFVNVSGLISNEDATIQGLELELIARPSPSITLLASGSYVDGKVHDLEFAPGMFKDVQPAYAPEWQATVLARYEFDAFGGLMSAQFDGSYVGDRFANLRNFQAQELDSYFLSNLRLTWTSPNERWRLSVFAENVFDETYITERFDLGTLCGCTDETVGLERRFYGSVWMSF